MVIVALLASGLLTRMAYAAPVSVAAQLRAVACCTQHRGTLPSQDDAGRCCGVESDAQDPTRTSVVAAPAQPALVMTFDVPIGVPAVVPAAIAGVATPTRGGAPPLFLAHLSLRN